MDGHRAAPNVDRGRLSELKVYMSELEDILELSPWYRSLWEYWAARRTEAMVPQASSIQIEYLLGEGIHVVTHKWISDDQIITTFVNSEQTRILGREAMGQNLYERLSPDIHEQVRKFFANIRDVPCGGLVQYDTLSRSEMRDVRRDILLPLSEPTPTYTTYLSVSCVVEALKYGQTEGQPIMGAEEVELTCFDIGCGLPS